LLNLAERFLEGGKESRRSSFPVELHKRLTVTNGTRNAREISACVALPFMTNCVLKAGKSPGHSSHEQTPADGR
jgi:hypothetical protein